MKLWAWAFGVLSSGIVGSFILMSYAQNTYATKEEATLASEVVAVQLVMMNRKIDSIGDKLDRLIEHRSSVNVNAKPNCNPEPEQKTYAMLVNAVENAVRENAPSCYCP